MHHNTDNRIEAEVEPYFLHQEKFKQSLYLPAKASFVSYFDVLLPDKLQMVPSHRSCLRSSFLLLYDMQCLFLVIFIGISLFLMLDQSRSMVLQYI